MMNDLAQVLHLDGLTPIELKAVYEKVGSEVLENTLLQFLAGLTEWEQSSFEQWIEAHAHKADMMSQLLLLYPDFGKIFSQEIAILSEKKFENFIGV